MPLQLDLGQAAAHTAGPKLDTSSVAPLSTEALEDLERASLRGSPSPDAGVSPESTTPRSGAWAGKPEPAPEGAEKRQKQAEREELHGGALMCVVVFAFTACWSRFQDMRWKFWVYHQESDIPALCLCPRCLPYFLISLSWNLCLNIDARILLYSPGHVTWI